jgi:hypothetical protein
LGYSNIELFHIESKKLNLTGLLAHPVYINGSGKEQQQEHSMTD